MNIATLQNIIFYEYLPALLGEASPIYTGYKNFIYNFSQFILNVNIINKVFQSFLFILFSYVHFSGYNPDINPSINHVFQSAAFRYIFLKKHICILLSKNIT